MKRTIITTAALAAVLATSGSAAALNTHPHPRPRGPVCTQDMIYVDAQGRYHQNPPRVRPGWRFVGSFQVCTG